MLLKCFLADEVNFNDSYVGRSCRDPETLAWTSLHHTQSPPILEIQRSMRAGGLPIQNQAD